MVADIEFPKMTELWVEGVLELDDSPKDDGSYKEFNIEATHIIITVGWLWKNNIFRWINMKDRKCTKTFMIFACDCYAIIRAGSLLDGRGNLSQVLWTSIWKETSTPKIIVLRPISTLVLKLSVSSGRIFVESKHRPFLYTHHLFAGVFGALDLHGSVKSHVWCRLAETARAGQQSVRLKEQVGWSVGESSCIDSDGLLGSLAESSRVNGWLLYARFIAYV